MEGRHKKNGGESLKKQLAMAVTSIQWSYAIFWSPSTQIRGLEWREGYYNGDIKTRKTIQAMVDKVNKFNDVEIIQGCERSDQLRELYEFLLQSQNNHGSRRPTAALSPEDLTNTEWYYLTCMSFVFSNNQGLPGRSLANGQPIWVNEAQYTSSGLFSRGVLAKSAGIKTIVCFPFISGVLELGIMKSVQEDLNLIQHVKTSFLDVSWSFDQFNIDALQTQLIMEGENFGLVSPRTCRNSIMTLSDCTSMSQTFLNLETSPPTTPTSTTIIDTTTNSVCPIEIGFGAENMIANLTSNEANINSLTSKTTISTTTNPVYPIEISSKVGKMNANLTSDEANMNSLTSTTTTTNLVRPIKIGCGEGKMNEDLRSSNEDNMNSLKDKKQQEKQVDFDVDEDWNYLNVVSYLLNKTHSLMKGIGFHDLSKGSSFVRWKEEGKGISFEREDERSQRMLKGILFEVPKKHKNGVHELKEDKKERGVRGKVENVNSNAKEHVLAERRRRKRVNQGFHLLKSIIPPTTKGDKVSILDETIAYLKELERRVEEVESCQELVEHKKKNKRKTKDMDERITCEDNKYEDNVKYGCNNKRKERYDNEECVQLFSSKDNMVDNSMVRVSMVGKDIAIEVKCPWRINLLLEIIQVVTTFQLDSHSIQSSNNDGLLSLTIKFKVGEFGNNLSVEMITQTLEKVIGNC